MTVSPPRRSRGAARKPMVFWTVAALAAACGSDDPLSPEEELNLPGTCASEGEAGTPLVDGVNCRTVDVDGYPREYLVYVPPGHIFSDDSPAPVVFMLHGSSGNGWRFLKISRWREKADEVGLIAVFPTSLEYFVLDVGRWSTRWHEYNLPDEVDLTQRLPGYPADAPWPADDVAFVHAMLDDLEAVAPVDPERFYVSGFSNGGTFTSRLAIEATDRIAAFAYVGGGFCHEVATAWTSDAPPRNAFQVLGASDHKLLDLIEAQTGQELDAMPLDPDSLLDVGPVAGCIASQVDAYGLAWEPYDVREIDGATSLHWSTPAGEPWGNAFRFTLLDGLDHNYPNGDNNPRGWVAVDRFWEFFQGLRLSN